MFVFFAKFRVSEPPLMALGGMLGCFSVSDMEFLGSKLLSIGASRLFGQLCSKARNLTHLEISKLRCRSRSGNGLGALGMFSSWKRGTFIQNDTGWTMSNPGGVTAPKLRVRSQSAPAECLKKLMVEEVLRAKEASSYTLKMLKKRILGQL